MMMNTYKSFTNENIPYMIPLVNLESNNNNNTKHQNLLDLDTMNPNPYNFNNNGFMDFHQHQSPLPIVPVNSYQFYNNAQEYPTLGFVKKEFDGFGGGRMGLNLGHRTYFSSTHVLGLERIFGRSRGLYSLRHQPPRCQAEGCKADLSGGKHYHRRHKVCEFHSKAPAVITGGFQQRFCQQCSRFHALAEFDETKRSCRKRLADHNRRRRKLQTLPSKNTKTNSSENTKQFTKSTKEMTTKSTALSTTNANAINITSIKGQDHYHNKENLLTNGPALSLGGLAATENEYEQFVMTDDEEKMQHHNMFSSSSSTPKNTNFHHNSLFIATPNYNQSTKQGGSSHGDHQTQNNNLLHLGQSMFEVDFL